MWRCFRCRLPARLLAFLCGVFCATAAPEAPPLTYSVIVTGGELLEGVYPDAHLPFITRTLRPLGAQCVASLTVDDNRQDLQAALRYAMGRASLVLVTGGLGPTPNDITRETLSEFTGVPLHEDPEALAAIQRRVAQPLDQIRPNLRRQALVPVAGGFLLNPNGTAAGLVFEVTNATIVALPGPPRELQPMVEKELVPFLQRRFGVRKFGSSLTLRFVGAGQSLIDQTIKDHVALAPGVAITSLFEGSRVDFTFSLPGHTSEDQAALRHLEKQIREHLGNYLYADDGSTLEEVVLRSLRRRTNSLALAEIGSHGAIAAALSSVKDSDRVLKGAFVGPTEESLFALLNQSGPLPASPALERAKKLTALAATVTGSRWALGTSGVQREGNAAPFVWLVGRAPDGSWRAEKLSPRNAGELSREAVTTLALDQFRRWLQ